jgi:hypothetical protein
MAGILLSKFLVGANLPTTESIQATGPWPSTPHGHT